VIVALSNFNNPKASLGSGQAAVFNPLKENYTAISDALLDIQTTLANKPDSGTWSLTDATTRREFSSLFEALQITLKVLNERLELLLQEEHGEARQLEKWRKPLCMSDMLPFVLHIMDCLGLILTVVKSYVPTQSHILHQI
jgi:hypothetical protein